jgi:hypothetical protein
MYGDPYFVFSDTISYLIDCIVVAGSKIVLSQRGFAGKDRTIRARAQIFSTTSQNENDLRLTERGGGGDRTAIHFFFFMHNAFDYSSGLCLIFSVSKKRRKERSNKIPSQ